MTAEARQWMVDGQLTPNKITDDAVLTAMRHTPREDFVPAAFVNGAYVDDEIPLGQGRGLMEPMVFATLVQAMQLKGGEQVLIIGGNMGYSAAILSHLARKVVMVEERGDLLDHARGALATKGMHNIELVQAPLTQPVATDARFDAILLEGAVQEIPEAILAQLNEGGVIAYVENKAVRPGVSQGAIGLGSMVSARKNAGVLTRTYHGEVGVTLLPGYTAAPAFRFA